MAHHLAHQLLLNDDEIAAYFQSMRLGQNVYRVGIADGMLI